MKREAYPLDGRTALVTGGARRLGRAMAEALAANGV
ncbi:MAG TPA: short-chain dehydrogenase, partial [Candidatus Hydrogenedentes bacterium]|nr:short-chain dehydrogenase [Candidatus Hydrogenedentota bacterium]